MPPEVDLVQFFRVGKEDDLRRQLSLGLRRKRGIDHAEVPGVVSLPTVLDDDWPEVHVDLVASLGEVVDGRDSTLDCRGAYVHQPRGLGRLEREAEAGLVLRVVVEQIPVDELGRERGLRVGQPPKVPDDVPDVTAHCGVDREIAVGPELVDPEVRVGLRRSELHALFVSVTLDGVLVAVQFRYVPVGRHLDPTGVGEAGQYLACPRVTRHVGLVVDGVYAQQPVGQRLVTLSYRALHGNVSVHTRDVTGDAHPPRESGHSWLLVLDGHRAGDGDKPRLRHRMARRLTRTELSRSPRATDRFRS